MDAGTAYVFVRSGTTWTQQAELTASDGAEDDNFGSSVALSGGTALVGAPNHKSAGRPEAGAAYVFAPDAAAPKATVKALTVPAAEASKGKTLKFTVTISDPKPSCGQASLAVRVTTKTGKLLGHMSMTAEPTNKVLRVAYKIPKAMAKGSYKVVVSATDLAGNVQKKTSSASLTVK
jgi:hypothetical protein